MRILLTNKLKFIKIYFCVLVKKIVCKFETKNEEHVVKAYSYQLIQIQRFYLMQW